MQVTYISLVILLLIPFRRKHPIPSQDCCWGDSWSHFDGDKKRMGDQQPLQLDDVTLDLRKEEKA